MLLCAAYVATQHSALRYIIALLTCGHPLAGHTQDTDIKSKQVDGFGPNFRPLLQGEQLVPRLEVQRLEEGGELGPLGRGFSLMLVTKP